MKKILKRIVSSVVSIAVLGSLMPMSTFAATASVNLTVGKGEDYDFSTVQAAVDAIKSVPTEKSPATITIADGVYEEEVSITKPYVHLKSESGNADKVVITYDKANGHEDANKNFGTDKTATVTVSAGATGFEAQNITIKNSYNIDDTSRNQVQAVAFVSAADKVVLDGCSFIGRQDTLYLKGASKGQKVYGSANNARVYVKDCYIEGTVDYIFGDATAYFDSCKLNMAYNASGGHFTAPNTTLFNIGYVFNNCELTVDKQYTDALASKIDLGRPWQSDAAYPNNGSESVYINCVVPQILNTSGFSLWDDTTVVNKIRFKEYGSLKIHTKKEKAAADVSKRADYVQQLTAEQAEAYNVYNVLKGSDGWNPAKVEVSESKVCDVTLNSYDISLPVNETFELKTVVLPLDAESKITFNSENEAVATVDDKGIVTAKAEGKTKVYATAENGTSVYAVVTVTQQRTALPSINNMEIVHGSSIVPGSVLKASYNYILASDTAMDAAMLRWYAVKDNQTYLIKEGVGEYYSSYEVQPKDIGCKIKLEILPATKTTYGEYNKAVSTTAKIEVTDGGRTYPELIERTDFNNGTGKWTANGTWKTVKNGVHTMLTADCSNSNAMLVYNKVTGNSEFEGRFRFNPDLTGFSSGGYFNIYSNKTDDSYYKLNFNRGGNTKSLIVSLYKKSSDSDEEVLLAKDETSLKNLIYQSAGEDNQYFYVDFTANSGKIDVVVRLEGSLSSAMKLSATDSEALKGGTTAIETSQSGVLMVDSISIESATASNEAEKQRVILIGDSTVKAYGDDNTIGGWGDYIVNYFDDNVEVINKAEAGMSSRSYINTGRLEKALEDVKEGDYVFFQFGHNDQRDSDDDSARIQYSVILGNPDANGVYPSIAPKKVQTPQFLVDFYKDTEFPYQETFYPNEGGTFKWYMQQYIDGIEAKGGIPVVVTPVCRIFFDGEGKITPHFGENDGYVTAAKQIAEENGVDCIDMFNITKSLYESYGVMTTQGLHNIKSDGTVDITHYNKFGANIVASKMADAIKEMDIPLSAYITGSVTSVDKTHDLKTAKLFVVGGAGAAADKSADGIKSGGYGDYLSKYLSSKITVENLALADKTAKSYVDTEEYQKFTSELGEGDYVMIAFGSNDGKNTGAGYSYSGGTKTDGKSFVYYLYNYYIKPAVEKKAVVILLTPNCDRVFDSEGKIVSAHQAYTDDVIAEVTAEGTYFVNLDDASTELYNLMGVEGSKVLNAYSKENGIMENALSEFGADSLAKKIISNMKYSSASLKDYINETELSKQTYMTRAAYIELVMNMLGIDEKCYDNFSDVAAGKSYENAIANAKRLGFVSGTNGMFLPELPLTVDLMKEVNENVCKYAGIEKDFTDVYNLAGSSSVSNEIGLYGIDVLFESLNK